jgi:hypothetical protein
MRTQLSGPGGFNGVFVFQKPVSNTMKTPQYRLSRFFGALILSGWISSQLLTAQAPPAPLPPPHLPPPAEAGGHKPGIDPRRMERARGQVNELDRAGKHEEARRLEKRLRDAQGPPHEGRPAMREMKKEGAPKKDARPGPIAPARIKMQHLKQAAEHLQAAGYEEYAAKARQEIQRIETEARREAGKGSEAGMREEMMKLRKELDELRGQLRMMKARGDRPRPDQKPEADKEPR